MSNEYQQDELIGIVSRALSAYAFAVRGGYKGTMEDFSRKLAALLNEGVTASVATSVPPASICALAPYSFSSAFASPRFAGAWYS